jgi:hypothetical protein
MAEISLPSKTFKYLAIKQSTTTKDLIAKRAFIEELHLGNGVIVGVGKRGKTGPRGKRGRRGANGSNGADGTNAPEATWLRAFSPDTLVTTVNTFNDVKWNSVQTSTPTDWTNSAAVFTFVGPAGAVYFINYEINISVVISNVTGINQLTQIETNTRLADTANNSLFGLAGGVLTTNNIFQTMPDGNTTVTFAHTGTYLIDTAQHTTFKLQIRCRTSGGVITVLAVFADVGGPLNISFIRLAS